MRYRNGIDLLPNLSDAKFSDYRIVYKKIGREVPIRTSRSPVEVLQDRFRAAKVESFGSGAQAYENGEIVAVCERLEP